MLLKITCGYSNRFARLFPVYAVTNLPFLPFIFAGAGVGIGGGDLGPLGNLCT